MGAKDPVTNLWAPIQSTVATRVTPTPNQLPLVDRVPILTYASVRGVRVTLNDAYIHQGYGR